MNSKKLTTNLLALVNMFGDRYQYRNGGVSKLYLQLRWRRARDLVGSQIQVTTGGFELRISCIRGDYLTHSAIKLYLLWIFCYISIIFWLKIFSNTFVISVTLTEYIIHSPHQEHRQITGTSLPLWHQLVLGSLEHRLPHDPNLYCGVYTHATPSVLVYYNAKNLNSNIKDVKYIRLK